MHEKAKPIISSVPEGQQPPAESDRQVQPVDDELPPRLPFPVVGIGASAGGLEAYTEFFKVMPPDSGMAFVLIQHLPPDRESLIAEILSRHTKMPVQQVEDGMAVQKDHVYIIRPGHTLTIKDGKLHLGQRLSKPGNNRPVDDFFKSLAEEQRQRAIAIIMSGMGSNGTAGAQAVKAVGGLCIAQDPQSAQFPSMPQHLIDAGYADYILQTKDIPDVLISYATHPYARGNDSDSESVLATEQSQVREILAVLRSRTTQDFSGYKKPTVLRRIQRRMGLNRVTTLGDYAKILRQTPSEVTALADDLLIHVTGFFRDADAWDALREKVIVPLVDKQQLDSPVRCWVSACSSGEEAYSLAMLLVEEAERANKNLDIKVFATDMADRSLQNARNGIYPGGIEVEMPPARLDRFFQKEEGVYHVRQDLRELVVFAPQNILQDPPFSRLDIVSCRNLLIYLEPHVQHRVLEMLHFGLRDGGALFLGTSETVAGAEEMFEPIDKFARIFRRVGPTRYGSAPFPLPRGIAAITGERLNVAVRPGARPSLAQLTARALLEHHTPAAVTIDRDHRIVYFHGDTEPFLAQPRGEATRELFTMLRDSVRGSVRLALHEAATKNAAVTHFDAWAEVEPGRKSRVAVTASPLDPKGSGDYYLISFQTRIEQPPSPVESSILTHRGGMEIELSRLHDELKSTIEELQTSNEELKASNEEVMSMNEELQSTNEELETSREEMQSLNEELTTVNAQLQDKIEEHQRVSNDLGSLLTSTNIAVLFLDVNLKIRRFTPAMTDLLELISSDAGRPLADLSPKFNDPNLATDAALVLERLVPIEREITTTNGHWYIRRALPYRTTDNRIDGVVLTFVDITALKTAQDSLRESAAQFQAVVDLVPDLLWRNDSSGAALWHNARWLEYTGQSRESARGLGWLNSIHPDERSALRDNLQKAENAGKPIREEVRIRDANGAFRWFLIQASPALEEKGAVVQWFGTATDINEQRTALEAMGQSEEQVHLMFDSVHDFAMFMLDPDRRINGWNPAAERILGWTEAEVLGKSGDLIFTPEDRVAGAPEKERDEAVRTGRAADERWHLKKNGDRFWGSGVMSAVHGPDGQLRGLVKIFRDETARKRAEDALQEASLAAVAANRMKDEFLATLSHELRTPLGAILLWSKYLRTGPDAMAELNEGLDAIENSAKAQQQLIEDMLDTARINSGKLRLEPRETNLHSLLHSSIEAILPAVQAKGLTIKSHLSEDLGLVLVDPDRLRQVIWNLLTNAVKFTPSGGQVDVELRRLANQVEIRVSDTGAGIPPEFLPYVFERFRQADASHGRIHGGLGLGLAITKQLVELHGRSIQADSPGVGKGATFTVHLGLQKGKTGRSMTEAGSPNHEPRDPRDILSRSRILLIEDDKQTRAGLAILLRRAGAHLTLADSAAAGFNEFNKSRPDLIISDIGLPGEDGYSLMRRLRAAEKQSDPTSPPLPAIALTAFAHDQDRRNAIDAGFHHHVSKPVDPQGLISLLVQMLDRP